MIRLLTAACALVLSGCATPGAGQAVLKNLEGCTRAYNGIVSGGLFGAGFSGSVEIRCEPAASTPPDPG